VEQLKLLKRLEPSRFKRLEQSVAVELLERFERNEAVERLKRFEHI
jgi:hypothetical protein